MTNERIIKIIQTIMRSIIWGMWFFLIALDAIALSVHGSGAYWLPWVFFGLFMAWVMDGWIREEKILRVLLVAIPYTMLCDFVMSY